MTSRVTRWLAATRSSVSSLTDACTPDSWISCEATIRSAAQKAITPYLKRTLDS